MLKKKFDSTAPGHKALLLSALGTIMALGVTPGAEAGTAVTCPGDDLCQVSSVSPDEVTDLGGGNFLYEYTVNNDSVPTGDLIVDWELPYFSDSTITNIMSPAGWDWTIETIGVANPATGWEGVAEWQTPGDPFYEGPTSPFTTGTQVLHWFTCLFGEGDQVGESGCFGENAPGSSPIFPVGAPSGGQTSLGGFSFEASFGPTGAPYQASWATLPVRTGDPDFPLGGGIPASPMAVPAPATLPLAVLGAVSAFAATRRRRRTPG